MKTTPTPVPFDVFKQTLFWPGREYLWLELKMKVKILFNIICFHIPLSNRDGSTNSHLISTFTKFFKLWKTYFPRHAN